jgi:hypothetical protein
VNDVTRVREILGPDGEHWIKGQLHNDERTAFCLAGALQHMTRAENQVLRSIDEALAVMHRLGRASAVISKVIAEQYPERRGRGMARFNDHPRTTWADVEAVLEKAEQRLDERSSL